MAKNYLITGGAGFIGSNYARRLLSRGERLTILDNLSRKGADSNLEWLYSEFGEDAFQLVVGDVSNAALMAHITSGADIIVHLAGQVAVTTSVCRPHADFQSNAFGTFNVLEGARLSKRNPVVLYASTNKVYGEMKDVDVEETPARYRYRNMPFGVSEDYHIDFVSPYGCSKGAGDQYVHDYHRIYGLPTVVLRQSCIYGPRQFGMEDQGWLGWFIIAATNKRPITIYGDGKQVRDLLYVEDLLDVYDAILYRIEKVAGEIYNIGGGPQNSISVWQELGPLLEQMLGREIPVLWSNWRPGDQKIYISDIRKAASHLEWQPTIRVEEGIHLLQKWASENQHLFA